LIKTKICTEVIQFSWPKAFLEYGLQGQEARKLKKIFFDTISNPLETHGKEIYSTYGELNTQK